MLQEIRVKDIGPLDGPILVFGGAYSNLEALQALKLRAEAMNIPPARIICTGDIVAYCADAEASVTFVQDWGVHIIAGNCEKNLASDQEDCGCGFEEGTTCAILSDDWYAHAKSSISERSRVWMTKLSDRIVFNYNGLQGVVVHGAVSDVARFLWKSTPESALSQELAMLDTKPDLILSGHSGMTWAREVDGTNWVNAGAIGMPAHNGKRATEFAVLSDQVTFHSLDYDWQTAQAKMRDVGLTQGYDVTLETGFWPSEDVLPVEMRINR